MKTNWLKSCVIASLVVLVAADINAQTKPKPRGTRQSTSRPQSGYGNSGYGNAGYGSGYTTPARRDTTKPRSTTPAGGAATGTSAYGTGGYGSSATPTQQPSYNQNLPIEVIKGGSSGIGDSVAPSLRLDNAIEGQLIKDRTPLAYEHIREDDAVYKQRVWREIDTREKMNLPFRYAANEDNGNQRFISILFDAIQAGNVTAFNGEDDRFTTPMTKEQVAGIITGGNDTLPVTDINTGEVIKYEVRQRMIEPDSIYRFRLKEEWIFDKESSRMFVRILGIAPVMTQYTSTGIPIGDRTLFWAYYPDLRPTLSKYEVYNGKNFAGRMSWEELFESRFFSSYITKSTIDNPFDLSLKSFVKDPLFRLLEGENIKEKIFNYEQDLWSH
ncbi:gliding motility protein GldN [Segetibacter sp. 3557_3]|uniref:type IX secretion system ring protein PorN/GldN n=1 Tax=Segetibacter sp. 3557_3 TaxID=2547429 RepID=UPI0010589D6A|nr:gliding motility protein GldN [Segetibacter sp. 3557_3]TDH19789.1 gliding motility protein GldN [Segetibacter sp. 3557_3]